MSYRDLITIEPDKRGGKPVYAYHSPDFNPIEMLWSTVKSLVRMFPTRAMSAREQLIELALMLIGTKCCYCTN
ncbi:MAG: hypothetical protein GDA48_02135 [Hormoscilla sp. GM102CHS1]|nr:hypothetical protein [Hormoscilla sp. GM102CHS1]